MGSVRTQLNNLNTNPSTAVNRSHHRRTEDANAAIMSHTASQTWLSTETREFEAWVRVRNTMMYVAPKSPFTPRTFGAWISHRLAWMEEKHSRLLCQALRRAIERGRCEPVQVGPVLGGKKLPDGLALVLARETIWVPRRAYPSIRDLAPWPSYEEFKHEGDDRSKSGYCRFPPLPRGHGNETVNWKQRMPVKQHRFDEVGRPALGAGSVRLQYLEGEILRLVGNPLLAELGWLKRSYYYMEEIDSGGFECL
ncbi:hypothetical protein BDBG_03525 [Blastomyces gilchristii SLH14081]|uniref:Uncharacterized protein n=1 Tax=Blastomyces gilchristii (strain SLH14081) TaxID=559298 RepID=A0A179UJZ5_BLAGS|nr:uncharacterized protein BDBG_03525 [Blastomyces gilchristii SLH14081]OAT07467.1 hypothetical protein BDBG_03525 [Blastomyces gilchristii SLH14081]